MYRRLAVVFHNHVGGLNQFPEHFPALIGFEVEHYASFAPVDIDVADGVENAGGIVNLDDIGAKLAESASTGRPSQNDAKVEHPHTLQRAEHFPVGLGGRWRWPRRRSPGNFGQYGVGVLAQSGGATLDCARCPAQPDLHTGLLHGAVLSVLNFHHHLAGDGVLVHQPFVHGLAGRYTHRPGR